MMTRKHFEKLAMLIGESNAYLSMKHNGFIDEMCNWLVKENSRFDKYKFREEIEKWRSVHIELYG